MNQASKEVQIGSSQSIKLPLNFELNSEMLRCVELVKNGKNVFITGNAGTGKSTLLTYLRQNFLPEDTAVAAQIGRAHV